MAQADIFNSKKRRILRKQISLVENLSGLLLLFVLVAITIWFISQQDNYAPEERDISMEQLLQKKNSPQLYPPPFKAWVEPGLSPAANSAPKLGLFPETVLDQEWRISSRLKEFTAENLYQKINGEAEKFIKQGFQSLSYLSLQANKGKHEIAIELYDQGDLGGSMGIFSDHLSADKVIEQAGSVIYFLTSAGAIGRKGRFFFRIAGNQSTEKIRGKAAQLVKAFATLAETENEIPKEFHILNEGMAIPLPLISYQKQNVFQYDFAQDFWFGRIALNQKARIFIHQGTSSQESGRLFEELLAELSYDYQIIEEGETQVLLFHEYLKNYFVISQAGAFVFGIENVANQDQIAPLMKKIISKFEDG